MSVAQAGLDVRDRVAAPGTEPGLVGAGVGVQGVGRGQPGAERGARPLRVLPEGRRRRVEVHRAHPQPELHRRDGLRGPPRRCRPGSAAGNVEVGGVAGLAVLRGVGVPVARRRLPAVVEDERVDAEAPGQRRGLQDGRVVHVVLGAGRDPVAVGAVGVEREIGRVRREPVVAQVPGELPRLVDLRIRAEAEERGVERERGAGRQDAVAGRAVGRVLRVTLLLQRAERDDVARPVDLQAAGGAVVTGPRGRQVVALGDQEGRVAVGALQRQPLPRAGQRGTGAAVRVSRQVPGCASPTAYSGPAQPGSRQSAPARRACRVGAAVPTATSSRVAPRRTRGAVGCSTVRVRNPATPS